MNMIPLVRATEPGRAQLVNPNFREFGIVVLRVITSVGSRVSSFGKRRRRG